MIVKRILYEEICPGDDNDRNRLHVRVYDVVSAENNEQVGVGYSVVAEAGRDEHWVNVHPAEIDELVRMLMDAKLTAQRRLKEKGLDELRPV